ncbi:alcohol dehydrogenase [Pacificimonas flava]|uniref:Alcohol dehydrogenase n=2 Tax=Pacificimonas TaxID=1960290 RepID=A0A219B0F8_9SPHN|nr:MULTISPECIES: alcohol dehydrogenase [Pacificimonas]OWV31842.1 alcohol dehydrogenase [Pacificimonas flava]
MKALGVTGSGSGLTDVDLAAPSPTGTEVVLQVDRCGVCHSDVHLWEGGFDFGGETMSLEAMQIPFPLVLGHEILGTVCEVGPDAEDIAVGDRRIVYPWIGCGHCVKCASGRDDLCPDQQALGIRKPGGFGEKVCVPHSKYLVDPGDIDPSWAATLACSGLTAYGAVRKCLPAESDRPVVVIGAGGVGLSAISILRALGHSNILAVDIDDQHLAAAQDAGAAKTINTSSVPDPVETLMTAAGGPIAAVIDFVNGPMTAPLAFALPEKGGTVVQVGLFGGAFPLPLAGMAVRAISLQGSYVGSLQELRDLVGLARTGRLRPPPIAERQKGEASEVLAGLRDGKIVGRVVLEG